MNHSRVESGRFEATFFKALRRAGAGKFAAICMAASSLVTPRLARAQILSPPTGMPSTAGFGSAVTAVRGWGPTQVMVGAPRAPSLNAVGEGGRVFLFTANGDGTFSRTDINPGSVAAGSRFGATVVLKNPWLFVGAPGAGRVYVFRQDLTSFSWTKTTFISASTTESSDSLDYDPELGVVVACAQGSCRFFSQQGADNWMPVWGWPTLNASRARFMTAGTTMSDLITASTDPFQPGGLAFFKLASVSTGYRVSTVIPWTGGGFGPLAAENVGNVSGEAASTAFVPGPFPGQVQNYVGARQEGIPHDTGFLTLPQILLPGLATAPNVSSGAAAFSRSAAIQDRVNSSTSVVRHYNFNYYNDGVVRWELDPTKDFGTGGPTYGSVVSMFSGTPVIGDPSNNAVTVYPAIQQIVTVPNPVYDNNGQDTGAVVYTTQFDGTGSIKTSWDPDCTAFKASSPTSPGQGYFLLNGQNGIQCTHVDRNGVLLTGQQKVCFKKQATAGASLVRCHVKPSCGLDEDGNNEVPIGAVSNNQQCCVVLSLDQASVPGSVCAPTTNFSDFGLGELIDADQDFVPDIIDNCKSFSNFFQVDADHDFVGDGCDNCQAIPNQDQADFDKDGLGNACDSTPGVDPALAVPAPAASSKYIWLLGLGLAFLGMVRAARYASRSCAV
jgi:hypothetical protein